MEMVLLDWTRMGKHYCLAGAVVGSKPVRMVRPLLAKFREPAFRNVGWSAYLMDGYSRWDIFELIGAEAADPLPPHVEDIWVRAMRPCRRSAPAEERRAILEETAVAQGLSAFGVPLTLTRSSAYLPAGAGERSLATRILSPQKVRFSASLREGAEQADVRAGLGIAPLGDRLLPVKDHHLLLRAERASGNLTSLARNLDDMVRAMGESIAVRFGLSRPAQNAPERVWTSCWLMIDGIFSLTDPQT
jgi:hypothetical protein